MACVLGTRCVYSCGRRAPHEPCPEGTVILPAGTGPPRPAGSARCGGDPSGTHPALSVIASRACLPDQAGSGSVGPADLAAAEVYPVLAWERGEPLDHLSAHHELLRPFYRAAADEGTAFSCGSDSGGRPVQIRAKGPSPPSSRPVMTATFTACCSGCPEFSSAHSSGRSSWSPTPTTR
ncbi:DUF1877 family protein [Streptomyces libani]|uniref:DUF1877 family protein n=1 Tax=Streptomyces nigrescens TaxID=1920 RepID=UPI003820C2A5